MAVRVDKNVILSIDIGTTYLKCTLYDLNLDIINSESLKLNVLTPKGGYFEIEPHELLNSVKECIKKGLVINNKKFNSVRCIGISTQRNSVLLWNKETGEPLWNFILWNDKRNTNVTDSLNHGVGLTGLKMGSKFLTAFTSNHYFNAFSKYRYATTHVSTKLIWLFSNLKNYNVDKVVFGCIESWLLYNLTVNKTHSTDITCAGCTGFYDIFQGYWSGIMCTVTGIPKSILPEVFDTCHNFGDVTKNEFETADNIPITAVIGDAQSSFMAECAFNIGDVVITIGTGAFISVNVGSKPTSSNNGMYPLVAYKYMEDQVCILHNASTSAGNAIEWAKSIGLFNEYSEIEPLLNSVENSDSVYFVPAFGSLEVNSKDTKCAAGFVGLKPSTTKAHLFRAIIDSIVFDIEEKYNLMLKDLQNLGIKLNTIRISGGVAQSDFICQYLANLLNHSIERGSNFRSSSSLGAAMLAGIGAGIWVKKEELLQFNNNKKVFSPDGSGVQNGRKQSQIVNNNNYTEEKSKWNEAIKRLMNWYS